MVRKFLSWLMQHTVLYFTRLLASEEGLRDQNALTRMSNLQ